MALICKFLCKAFLFVLFVEYLNNMSSWTPFNAWQDRVTTLWNTTTSAFDAIGAPEPSFYVKDADVMAAEEAIVAAVVDQVRKSCSRAASVDPDGAVQHCDADAAVGVRAGSVSMRQMEQLTMTAGDPVTQSRMRTGLYPEQYFDFQRRPYMMTTVPGIFVDHTLCCLPGCVPKFGTYRHYTVSPWSLDTAPRQMRLWNVMILDALAQFMPEDRLGDWVEFKGCPAIIQYMSPNGFGEFGGGQQWDDEGLTMQLCYIIDNIAPGALILRPYDIEPHPYQYMGSPDPVAP